MEDGTRQRKVGIRKSPPPRIGVLAALAEGPATAEELAARLGSSPRAMQRHLRALEELGLVAQGGDGIYNLLHGAPHLPAPPAECLRCGNSSYVLGLLEEMGRLLWEARKQQERLRHLSALILQAQEEERKRVARELHDDTAQILTALLVRLNLLKDEVDPSLASHLAELRELVSAALEGVRRIAQALRPSALDHLGLTSALGAHVAEFSQRWGLPVHLHLGELPSLPPEVELALYRVAQEALSNVAKHANASEAWLVLRYRGARVILEVKDNGRGFSLPEVLGDGQRGLGIMGMEERLALVGGRLRVRSRPGRGTIVRAEVPINTRG